MRLLVVCTANACRSVMAEAFLSRRQPTLEVTSAGLLADGRPPDPRALDALRSLGLSPVERPSRRLDRSHLAWADLILGMDRQHVREVVVLDQTVFGRTFTLGELARRGEAVGARRHGEPLPEWLSKVHEGRSTTDLLRPDPDDISDPSGGPPRAYAEAAGVIQGFTARVLTLLRVTEPSTSAPGVTRQLTILADRASEQAARVAASAIGPPARSRLFDTWEDVGRAVSGEIASGAATVLCVTEEPHGTALVANRDPATRAVAAGNAGVVARARRMLDANTFCVGGAVDRSMLQSISLAAAGVNGPQARTRR